MKLSKLNIYKIKYKSNSVNDIITALAVYLGDNQWSYILLDTKAEGKLLRKRIYAAKRNKYIFHPNLDTTANLVEIVEKVPLSTYPVSMWELTHYNPLEVQSTAFASTFSLSKKPPKDYSKLRVINA